MDKTFLAWLAGFWEGEGFVAQMKSNNFRVVITQTLNDNKTTEQTMKLIQSYFKGKLYKYRPRNKKYLSGMHWIVNNHTEVLYFLTKISPYCKIRKSTVLDIIDKIKNKNYNKFRDYNNYLNKIQLYLNRGYSYRTISNKIAKYISISDSTICRIIKKYKLRRLNVSRI